MDTAKPQAAAPKKSRRVDPLEKRSRVTRTARRLFVEKGYHNVSIPAIVQASGVSTGAIYSYFPSKEALARHLHEETLAEFHSRFTQRLEGRETTHDRLQAFAEVVCEMTEQDPDLMEYLLFMRHAEFMQECSPLCFTEPFRLIQATIKEGMARGDLRSGDFFIAGVAFTGAILRAAELRLQCVLIQPLTEITEQLFGYAWAAVRA